MSTKEVTMTPNTDIEGGKAENSNKDSEVEIVFESDDAKTNTDKTLAEPSFSKHGSQLSVSDDPFAPREGKTLLWKNVNMTLVRLCKPL